MSRTSDHEELLRLRGHLEKPLRLLERHDVVLLRCHDELWNPDPSNLRFVIESFMQNGVWKE